MDSFKQNKNSVFSAAQCENKKYEAFGNLIWSEGTLEDNREFTSKEKDPTGFHYFGARYYSGDIGRFLSPDPHTLSPWGFELTDPQTLNPYVYCTNDPLYYFDPNGLYRTQTNNIVCPVTRGLVFFEAGISMVPVVSLWWVGVRRFGVDDEQSFIEYTTGVDWLWGVLGMGGAPTSIGMGAVTATGILWGLNEAANDRITLGMFAAKHPGTVISGGRIDLNKIESKNKAEIITEQAKIQRAKEELIGMEKFAKEIRKGRKAEDLVHSGGGPFPDKYLEYYNKYKENQKDQAGGYYDNGIYHDEHGLYTAY